MLSHNLSTRYALEPVDYNQLQKKYFLYTLSQQLNMLKMHKSKNLEKAHLLRIGGLVVVAGIIILLVATQHGPTIVVMHHFAAK